MKQDISIFNDPNYLLCKVGYNLIHIIELETGKRIFLERNNKDVYVIVKGSSQCFSGFAEITEKINKIMLYDIESFLWLNIKNGVSPHFNVLLNSLFPERRVSLDSEIYYKILKFIDSEHAKEYAFENKMKGNELLEIILNGILYYSSRRHLLNGKMTKKSGGTSGIVKTYMNFN